MPTGRVKTFKPDAKYGFITPQDGGRDIYVAADAVLDGTIKTGDTVSYEIADTDSRKKAAASVKVEIVGPEFNPVGRTMAPPPSWDELDERDRQARAARRRRR